MDEVEVLIAKAIEYKLGNAGICRVYPLKKIKTIYNGTGADWMPEAVRHWLDSLNPALLPAVLIHDLEYFRGGTRQDFLDSNRRLRDNIRLIADLVYPWYHPRRYLSRRIGDKFQVITNTFGYIGWSHSAITATIY